MCYWNWPLPFKVIRQNYNFIVEIACINGNWLKYKFEIIYFRLHWCQSAYCIRSVRPPITCRCHWHGTRSRTPKKERRKRRNDTNSTSNFDSMAGLFSGCERMKYAVFIRLELKLKFLHIHAVILCTVYAQPHLIYHTRNGDFNQYWHFALFFCIWLQRASVCIKICIAENQSESAHSSDTRCRATATTERRRVRQIHTHTRVWFALRWQNFPIQLHWHITKHDTCSRAGVLPAYVSDSRNIIRERDATAIQTAIMQCVVLKRIPSQHCNDALSIWANSSIISGLM